MSKSVCCRTILSLTRLKPELITEIINLLSDVADAVMFVIPADVIDCATAVALLPEVKLTLKPLINNVLFAVKLHSVVPDTTPYFPP